MKDGFLKAAALSPALRVADCAYNTRQILTELRAAAARGVKLAVFPEFCLTGYILERSGVLPCHSLTVLVLIYSPSQVMFAAMQSLVCGRQL